jgi:hypothetical protein
MQPSLVTARRLLLQLISPLIQELLNYLEDHPGVLHDALFPRLRQEVPVTRPALWAVTLDRQSAPGFRERRHENRPLNVGDLTRDSRHRDTRLAAVPLVARRGTERLMLPGDDLALELDDELLFCSTAPAEQQIKASLASAHALEYLNSGTMLPRGHAMTWWHARRSGL